VNKEKYYIGNDSVILIPKIKRPKTKNKVSSNGETSNTPVIVTKTLDNNPKPCKIVTNN